MSSEAIQVRETLPRYLAETDAQDVPPGYKRTEAGVVPSDWEVRPLRDDVSLLSGHHVLAEHCNSKGIGTPYLTGPADFPDGRITHTKFTQRPTTLCAAGDILVTVKGSGSGMLIEADAQYCISRQLMAIRAGAWNSRFLYYSLLQNASRIRAASSGLIPGLSRDDILNQGLPVPTDTLEQRAIAAALSDVDGLLGALEALIAKKRAIKQAAMQQLLTGKTRLPGFSGEWETKRLGDIAHIKTGSRNNEDKVADGHYPFFVRSEFVERIDTYSYDCEAILVPGEGRIGEIFHYVQGRFDVHQRVYAITNFAPEICGRFVYFVMTMTFGPWAMQNTVKATVDSLRLPTFQNFAMQVPTTRVEQTAIASVLSDFDAEIAALEARRDKTRAIKQGMMQELLTGRVRLVKALEASA